MTYFQSPDVWEMVKGIWIVFWGLTKMLWPVWLLVLVLLVFKLLGFKLDKKISDWKLRRTMKKCPDCAEWVPIEAKVCSYCRKDL